MLWTMHAGGVAGIASWTVQTPQDMIKTRQQAHLGPNPPSMICAAKLILAEGGISRMFSSIHIILARGYLVSFVALPMYEWMKGLLDARI